MAAKKQKKKAKKGWMIPVGLALLLAGYSIFMYWRQWQEEHKAKFAIYPAFGIELPLGYPIRGIDVSSHQRYIFWLSVQQMRVQDAKLQFAFIKATEGLKDVDKQFKYNWQAAKQAGLVRGAYHYFLATKSGKDQAKNFVNTVKIEPGDLPPVLDVEQLYGINQAVMRKGVQDWLQTVEAAYKIRPIIYSSADFYVNYLGKDFADYPLWVAHYLNNDKPRIKRDWVFWQHSEAGRVNGITTNVDFNVFGGDSLQFAALLVK